jgi:hypothetical protein
MDSDVSFRNREFFISILEQIIEFCIREKGLSFSRSRLTDGWIIDFDENDRLWVKLKETYPVTIQFSSNKRKFEHNIEIDLENFIKLCDIVQSIKDVLLYHFLTIAQDK